MSEDIERISSALKEAEVLSLSISKLFNNKNVGIVAMALICLEDVLEKHNKGLLDETRSILKIIREEQ